MVANWNGANHLKIALPTLKRQTYSPLEILVVDNGSVDSSHQVAAENEVTWVAMTQNRGLAAAWNEGARQALGQYLIFLNNDMRFPPDFVRMLVAILHDNPDLFAADARQLDWEGSTEIHSATRLRTGSFPYRGLIPGLDFVQESVGGVTDVMQASAAMAVRRSMFENLGGFDERLLVGWEDTEICWRAWLRGWRTVLVPEAVCWHHLGSSSRSGHGAAARFRGTLGGRLLFAMKHLPWPYAVSTWAVSVLGFAKDLATGRVGSLVPRARVLTECARFVPALLSERRRIYRNAGTVPRAHLDRMLSIGGTTPE